MISGGRRVAALPFLVLGLACTHPAALSRSDALGAQEAAVEFVAKQGGASEGPAICLHMATEPGDVVGGRVTNGLQDPPADLLQRLHARGISVQPFSSCKRDERVSGAVGWLRGEVVIGWPSATAEGADLRADSYCGMGCGSGYKVDLRRRPQGWRVVATSAPWMT